MVLTGGPCSGKSSALSYLQRELQSQHVHSSGGGSGIEQQQPVVYCAPEAATLLVQTGIHFDPKIKCYTQQLQDQLAICRMQLALEDNLARVAASRVQNSEENQKAIILCDRGIIDNKGYMSETLWREVLSNLYHEHFKEQLTEHSLFEDSLLQRYQGVIHMDTAAKGALSFFKNGKTVDDSGKTVFRRESPEQASALDDQMWDLWQSHPHHRRIQNRNSSVDDSDENGKTKSKSNNPFQIKLDATLLAVQDICNRHFD